MMEGEEDKKKKVRNKEEEAFCRIIPSHDLRPYT